MTTVIHHDTRCGMPTASWSAWSCTVRLVVSDRRVLDRAVAAVAALMDQVDRAASRFRADSELSRANALAGRPVPVSRTLVDLVSRALDAARLTGGAVDPTLGRDLVRLGYDRDILLLTGCPDADAAADSDCDPHEPGVQGSTAAAGTSWHDVRVNRDMGLLTVPGSTWLDLGSTAKAQTADWAATTVYARYGCDVLVEIGGDLAVAGAKRDWQVTVAEREGSPGQQVGVLGGGLATSTTTVRTWTHAGRAAHHILDPATGEPVDGPWRTASVAAGSALAANVHSTAALVKGAGAESWLRRQGLAARLVDRAGHVLLVGGWPDDRHSGAPQPGTAHLDRSGGASC